MWASPTDVTYFIFLTGPWVSLLEGLFFSGAHTGTVSTGVDLDSTIVPREISAAP